MPQDSERSAILCYRKHRLLHQVRPVLAAARPSRPARPVAFAQRDGLYATFLDCVQGRNMLAVRMEIGARLPLSNIRFRYVPDQGCAPGLMDTSFSRAFAPLWHAVAFRLAAVRSNACARYLHRRS